MSALDLPPKLDLPPNYHYISMVFAALTVAGILWGIIGFPLYPVSKEITINSAEISYISPELFGSIDCKVIDTSGNAYYLPQGFQSKYWCIHGWNRTEEIQPGQIYKIEVWRGLFGYTTPLYSHTLLPEIFSMERV